MGQFGQRMVADHGKILEQAQSLARQKGLATPREPDARDQRLHDILAKVSGMAFDRTYTNEMLKDHKKDVADFERHANQAKDADVRTFAANTLPILKEHLIDVQRIRKEISEKSATAR